MGRPLRVGGSYGQPLRARVCQGCHQPFLGVANTLRCPTCALIRRRQTRNAWKRARYAASRAFRAQARRGSRDWARRQMELRWPVPCSICGAPVAKLRGRHRGLIHCARCRVEQAEIARREVQIRGAWPRRRSRAIGPARHHYDPWTAGDEARVRAGRARGLTYEQIGAALGRTPRAVRARAAGMARVTAALRAG